jgi:uncharacterized cupin superfamily protein
VTVTGTWSASRWAVRGRSVAKPAGAKELAATLYELAAGASGFHLHAHYGLEELFVVLEGTPTLRTHEADRDLKRGDVVACPRGRDGTHTFANFPDVSSPMLDTAATVFAA